jgi:hypothetical protein
MTFHTNVENFSLITSIIWKVKNKLRLLGKEGWICGKHGKNWNCLHNLLQNLKVMLLTQAACCSENCLTISKNTDFHSSENNSLDFSARGNKKHHFGYQGVGRRIILK